MKSVATPDKHLAGFVAVEALIAAAVARAKAPVAERGPRRLIIRSGSAKQRVRRKPVR